jgi:tetratricopeptide (TPR) repeat protein
VIRAGAALALALAGCAPALRPLPVTPADGDPAALAAEVHLLVRRLEQEPTAEARERLAARAVEAGQRCDRAAPATPTCDYALAVALGVQARERPSTGLAALPAMVQRLERAAAADARLDRAGPNRVLALLRLRAPGWPVGPGDPEAGLEQARRAVGLFPEHAPNQLALAEALEAAGDLEASRAAAARALALAQAAGAAGDPDAAGWVGEAHRRLGPP